MKIRMKNIYENKNWASKSMNASMIQYNENEKYQGKVENYVVMLSLILLIKSIIIIEFIFWISHEKFYNSMVWCLLTFFSWQAFWLTSTYQRKQKAFISWQVFDWHLLWHLLTKESKKCCQISDWRLSIVSFHNSLTEQSRWWSIFTC